jgi:hypothetical protein
MDFGTLWDLSYRSIVKTQYTSGNGIATQKYNILLNRRCEF